MIYTCNDCTYSTNSAVLYCTVLYCTVLYCTVLYCTVLAVLYSTVLYCTVLYCTVLAVLYSTVLYCTLLYSLYCTRCTVLFCTLLYCNVQNYPYYIELNRSIQWYILSCYCFQCHSTFHSWLCMIHQFIYGFIPSLSG